MEDTGYVALEEAPISRKPSRKDPLRIQVICAAVQEGSLPASALENELRQDSSVDDDDENEGRKGSKDDETIKPILNYLPAPTSTEEYEEVPTHCLVFVITPELYQKNVVKWTHPLITWLSANPFSA
ncbi:hypothetical protein PPACK8108_LOCUS9917 [Phakopsora pachyrhizi]|uniref:Uncharacterized protein n=1 Tax=Phakopsora pachyrhizi TaxID=170000 RepID=A0AAV0B0Y1_PHAPC|nr:hypothetical protein PPACK8108_LOCUS9917 [Phakopsora pachyrhizi]